MAFLLFILINLSGKYFFLKITPNICISWYIFNHLIWKMNSIFFCCCCFVFVCMRSFHLVKSSALLVIGGHNSVQNLRRKGWSLSHKNLMKAYHGDWTFIEMHASYEDKFISFEGKFWQYAGYLKHQVVSCERTWSIGAGDEGFTSVKSSHIASISVQILCNANQFINWTNL